MAVTYMGPNGGLSAADKQTAAANMLKGTSILHGRVQGTIPKRAAAIITPGAASQTIAAGQYLTGDQTIAGDPNLVAENIKAGVTLFGVTGTLTYLDILPANLVLFSASTGLNPITGGFATLSGGMSCSIGSTISLGNPGEYSESWAGTVGTIDFTKYSNLYIYANLTRAANDDVRFSYSTGDNLTPAATINFDTTGTRGFTFNIASVTGKRRILLRNYRYGDRDQRVTIYEIKLYT